MKKIVLFCILILLIVVIVMNKCSSEGFANDEIKQTEIIWENKLLKLDTVIKSLKNSLSECGVSNIDLENDDFNVIDTRKRLIELLPVTKLLDKVTYDQVQCFVSKFDPENYLVISKTVSNVPKILRPRNLLIVNDILYNSTPYGVVKYIISQLSSYKGLDSLNASIECGILNDFNTFNTTNDPIFHLDGKIIQKRGNQFVDIRNNDYYEITDINNKIELLNKKVINKIELDKSQNNQVKNQIVQENVLNNSQINAIIESNVLEKMVDVGGLIELNISEPTQLKVIDSKTFIPVISTTIKNALAESEVRPEVIIKGEIVISEEAIRKELVAKGLPISEESIKKVKQELASNYLQVSDETIKKGLTTVVQVSEEDKIAALKLASLKALEKSKIKAQAPIIKKSDIDISTLIDTLVSIFEYDGVIYMTDSSVVRPYSSWAIKLNTLLAKNKLQIRGVIPHFYYLNNVFNYRLLFILTDDFYIWVNKENISDVLDIKKDLNIAFNPNIPDTLACDDLKIILEQMEKANVITREKSDLIIKNYRC